MNLFTSKLGVFFFLIVLSSPCYVSSQNSPELECGTVTSAESLEFYNSIRFEIKENENRFIAKSASTKGDQNIKTEYIPIKAHIIRNSQGGDGLNLDVLNEAIENLNATFKNIYIQFSLSEEIDYIDNDAFCHFNKKDESELTKNNYTKGALNIYFIKDIENESKNNICGYSNVTKNNHVILLKNSCVINDSSLSHEIGHFLSLVHTHGPNDDMTTELVDGSNCDTDGDGICDTPADPKLDSDNVDNFCNYIGTTTDVNGDVYEPDTKNIMSYSYKGCRTHFSKQQSARMYAFYQYIKMQFLQEISVEDTDEPLFADAKVYPNPVTDGTLNVYSKTNNATHYQIANFYGQVLTKGLLTTNKQIDVNNLSSGTYLLILNDENSRVVKKFIK